MKESDMDCDVRRWMASRLLTPYAELSVYGGPVDMVGVKGELVVAVEMKLTWKRSLLLKLLQNKSWANEVWFWCSKRPSSKTLALCREFGFGVMSSKYGELVLAVPCVHDESSRRRQIVFQKLERHDHGLIAGLPTQKNKGRRQVCTERIREYMRHNPFAKSAEVFSAVPNHYASFASFSGVFGAFIRDIRLSNRKNA